MRAHTLTLMLTALLLAGCGQKGPLYLPAEPDNQTITPAETQPGKTETDKSSQ